MRLTLLILLCEVLHAVWLLEQPAGSNDVLPFHPRLNWLISEVLYVPRLFNFFFLRYANMTL